MKRGRRLINDAGRAVLGLMLATAMVLATGSASASDAIGLTLKGKISVDREFVQLGDVATLSGGTEATLTELAKTDVAKAPLPGRTRFLSLDYIRIRLRQAGFQTDAIRFSGPTDVQISREAVALGKTGIEHAVEAAIRSRMPWKNEAVTIDDIHVDSDIQLPTGTLTYQIVPNRNEDYLGRMILALHLFVDGEPVRKTWVNANISVMADVVSVVRPVGKHCRLEPADLALVRRDLADLPADAVRSIAEALGNRTTCMIYPNTVLQAGMISLPPLVRRGDIVKIVANAGPMTITATGRVKQQGAKGDMIHVINTDSNHVITARVIGPGAVEVEF